MKVFRVVVDSSCLIGLAQVEIFGLLKEMFAEIYIPGAVYEEVVVKGRGEAGSAETESAIKDGWISMKAVNDEIAVNALTINLGKGESEVIILCKESGFDYALIDERIARDKASTLEDLLYFISPIKPSISSSIFARVGANALVTLSEPICL